jgi:4-amino-4-deoxy-L-arabinose transferase-like glycosyltransferase
MSALPPPPPSPPAAAPTPVPPVPERPPQAASPPVARPVPPPPPASSPVAKPTLKAVEPGTLMPYDDLFGSESGEPEAPPSLTFNVAAAPPTSATPAGAEKPPELAVPGIVASDDRPAYLPALPADEPPEPLLHSPVERAPPPPPFVPPPPPPAPSVTISELFDKVGLPNRSDDQVAPPPAMWQASAVPQSARPGSAPPAAGVATPRPAPLAPRPAPAPPVAASIPVPPAPPAPTFRTIAPAPVRMPPPPAPPAPSPAMRNSPLSADDDNDFGRPSIYDDQDTLLLPPHSGHLHSASPDADTVIAVSAPMRRAYGSQPSFRLLGLLMTVLLALWMARLGSAPLFDVDEGAFAEATRELTVGHDWGSTTLNGVDRFDKPILVYWFQAISLKTFGINEFAARLPSALCAFFWCLALGQFAWRRFGPQVAIAATGLLATSLGPMLIGRAATADSLLNLLLTLSTLDLWRHLENGRDAPRRRAFAWIGLGLLAKGPVALLIPAAAAGIWLLLGRDRSRLQRLVSDPRAWLLMVAIAAPWYTYAIWRHGMAFIDGFLLHHNLQRFTGSLEGHAGSLFYYFELLPVLMMPWAPLLVPLAMHLRTRWREPLGRFLLVWLGFVLVFFSLSGTKLPHYVLYGFTPLMLLVAQELVVMKKGVRFALFLTILTCVVVGAASPWIARYAAASTHDGLYQVLLSTAPAAPWVWLAAPIGLLVFALTIWVPSVRNYLSDADGAVFAAMLSTAWLVLAVLPWWGQTLQDPIRSLARTVPIAQLNLLDKQRVVQWKLHQPSIAYYLGQTAVRSEPVNGDWALTRMDRLSPDELSRYEVVQQIRGYALVRPASAASEPLSRIGAAQTAAEAASQAAFAQALAVAAEHVASEAAAAASQAAANAAAKLAPPATAPPPAMAPAMAAPAAVAPAAKRAPAPVSAKRTQP